MEIAADDSVPASQILHGWGVPAPGRRGGGRRRRAERLLGVEVGPHAQEGGALLQRVGGGGRGANRCECATLSLGGGMPQSQKGGEAMRGSGRVFKRKNIACWWIAYCHRGREIRESSGSEDQKVAEKFLKYRLKEIGADQLKVKRFIGPQQDRVTVNELLVALEADYRLRSVRSWPQFQAHLRPIRATFGDWRAIDITEERVDHYIEDRLAEEGDCLPDVGGCGPGRPSDPLAA